MQLILDRNNSVPTTSRNTTTEEKYSFVSSVICTPGNIIYLHPRSNLTSKTILTGIIWYPLVDFTPLFIALKVLKYLIFHLFFHRILPKNIPILIYLFNSLGIVSWDLYEIFVLIALEFGLRSKYFVHSNEFLSTFSESYGLFPSWSINKYNIFFIFRNSDIITPLEIMHRLSCGFSCIPQKLYLILTPLNISYGQ